MNMHVGAVAPVKAPRQLPIVSAESDVKKIAYEPRLPAAEAYRLLEFGIDQFDQVASEFLAIAADDRTGLPPALVIRAEAGLGKSTAVLKKIAAKLAADPTMRVLYLVPSLDLGDELADKALAEFGIQARVMRGRSQFQKGTASPMCAKADIAETLSSLNVSVSSSLCRRENDDGTISECPFYQGCAYIKQTEEAKQGGLIIASHQYLSVQMDALKDVDWVVVDESFWQVLCAERNIDLGRFTTFRGVGEGFRARKGESRGEFEVRAAEASERLIDGIARMANVIEDAARRRRPIRLADIEAEGFTADDCEALAKLELTRIAPVEITPSMDEDMQKERLQKAQVQECFGFRRIWMIVAAELRSGRPLDSDIIGLVAEYGVFLEKEKELRNVVHAYWHRMPRFTAAPTLIIDADADEEVSAVFYPQAQFMTIRAELRNVTITQVSDKTGSAYSLAREDVDKRRNEAVNAVLDMMDRLEPRHRGNPKFGVLAIGHKAVIDTLRASNYFDRTATSLMHFGNTRGKDGGKNVSGLVLLGRLEMSPLAAEGAGRSLWHNSDRPLALLVPDQDGRVSFPKCQHSMTDREGKTVLVAVATHPDQRIDRVRRLVSVGESTQAIARARLVWREGDNPCEVLVLSNMPLPIQPDRLVTWAEAVPDRFDLMALAGFIPEKSGDVVEVFPDLFPSATAMRMAAMRRPERAFPRFAGTVTPSIYNNNMAGVTHPSTWVRVSYERSKAGNRGGAIWVRLLAGDTLSSVSERVRAVLPDAHSFDAIIPEHAPQANAEAAERGQQRDDRTGFRYVSRATITLAQVNADALPKTRMFVDRKTNTNSLTTARLTAYHRSIPELLM